MVNVVADVLRNFFRQLESPLIPEYVQEKLLAVHEKSGFIIYIIRMYGS